MVIKEQFEMKDVMLWRLGLRNKEYINIQKLGLKCVVLNRNALTDEYTKDFYEIMQLDNYIRCVQLRHNNFTAKGVKMMQEFAVGHPKILSIDVRDNPGFHDSRH